MPGFLSSNLYYKYLSDLINSVRADEFVNVSSSGQGGMADSERSGSNANESSQIQVNQSLGHIFFPWRDPPLSADIYRCFVSLHAQQRDFLLKVKST